MFILQKSRALHLEHSIIKALCLDPQFYVLILGFKLLLVSSDSDILLNHSEIALRPV